MRGREGGVVVVHRLLHRDEIAEGVAAELLAVLDPEAELEIRDIGQQIDRRADEKHPRDEYVEREPERIPPTRWPWQRDLATDEARERVPIPLRDDQRRQNPDDEEIKEAVPFRSREGARARRQ